MRPPKQPLPCQAHPGRLSVLVPGVRWPCESFIRAKLSGLAALGLDITVATTSRAVPGHAASGFHLIHLCPQGELLPRQALSLTASVARLASMSQPGVLRKLWRAACLQAGGRFKDALVKFNHFTALAQLDADLIHFEWNSAAIDVLPLFEIWGRPIVISCRGSQVNIRPHALGSDAIRFRNGLIETFSKASKIHCVSEAMKREAQLYGAASEKIWVIRPAVDITLFQLVERDIDRKTLRLVSVGTPTWLKGHEYALLALRELARMGIEAELTLIGTGPDRERLLFTVEDLGLQSKVVLRGNLPHSEIVGEMGRADIYVHASLSEGIANSVLEAMATGLPVVTTDCGGMREVISNGIDGFIVAVRDYREMAAKLALLAQEPSLRREMGNLAHAKIRTDYSLSARLKQWTALFEETARRPETMSSPNELSRNS